MSNDGVRHSVVSIEWPTTDQPRARCKMAGDRHERPIGVIFDCVGSPIPVYDGWSVMGVTSQRHSSHDPISGEGYFTVDLVYPEHVAIALRKTAAKLGDLPGESDYDIGVSMERARIAAALKARGEMLVDSEGYGGAAVLDAADDIESGRL